MGWSTFTRLPRKGGQLSPTEVLLATLKDRRRNSNVKLGVREPKQAPALPFLMCRVVAPARVPTAPAPTPALFICLSYGGQAALQAEGPGESDFEKSPSRQLQSFLRC